jgi:hypothetical protein
MLLLLRHTEQDRIVFYLLVDQLRHIRQPSRGAPIIYRDARLQLVVKLIGLFVTILTCASKLIFLMVIDRIVNSIQPERLILNTLQRFRLNFTGKASGLFQ